MIRALDLNGEIAIIAIVVVLWIASMGAAWKVANILSTIASQLISMQKQTDLNAANINHIQSHFDIPQAIDPKIPPAS